MYISRMRVKAPWAEAAVARDEAIARHARIRLTRVTNVTYEDEVTCLATGGSFHEPWPTVVIALDAPEVVRFGGTRRVLEPGEAMLAPNGALRVRGGERGSALFVQWDPGKAERCDAAQVARLSHADLAALRALTVVLDEPGWGGPHVSHAMAGLFERLGALGIRVRRFEPRELDVEPRIARSARGIARALFECDRPAVCDLEEKLGVCARHASRHFDTVARHLEMRQRTWTRLRNSIRLGFATVFMTAPSATTERVAAMHGYSGPTAMCRAFARAGLPSPGSVRAAVARLA
jgi:hypothetical protein